MGTSPLDWFFEYYTSSEYSTIRLSLFPLETMTYEYMWWAMKALQNWVVDKTVKTCAYSIDVEGMGMVGIGQVTRTDNIPNADE